MKVIMYLVSKHIADLQEPLKVFQSVSSAYTFVGMEEERVHSEGWTDFKFKVTGIEVYLKEEGGYNIPLKC